VILTGRGRSGVGNPEIADGERRGADVVKFGTVSEADYAGARVRVTIGDEDDDDGHLVTGWLPMAGGRAGGDRDWHPLETGERVMVLSEGGELQNGIVMPAGLYSDDNPAPGDKAGLWRKQFSDDGKIEYDRESGEFLVDAKSKATVKVSDTTAVVEDGTITLKVSDTTITVTDGKIAFAVGDTKLEITSGGAVFTGGTVKHDGKAIDKTHVHLGVTAGGGVSGVPQ
jgi:phage baseplate assembly protein V